MVKWPFRRNQTDESSDIDQQSELPMAQQPSSNLPEEVQEYYESARRGRPVMAWLLGLVTLVITVLLALGLFFGGRWVYRKIAGNDQKPQQTAQNDNQNQQQNQQNQGSNNQNQQNQNQPSPQPSPAPQPAPAPQPSPSPQPAPQPAPAPRPSTPAPNATPNTGPGDVVAIVVAATVLSTAGFYIVQLKREN